MSLLPSSECQIIEVDGEHYLYNKQDDTYTLLQLLKENKKDMEQENEKVVKEEKKIWTNESTITLINLVGDFDEQFQTSIKKYVWMKISKILNDKLNIAMTWQQCDTKWKGLLKIYKDIKEHNSTSGKNRRRWEYFEAMNEILHNKPEITPVATCSSMAGLVVNKELSSSDESTPNEQENINEKCSKDNKRGRSSTYKAPFSKKRLATVNAVERRHQEKMQRQDNFLKCFNEYIEILRNKKDNND